MHDPTHWAQVEATIAQLLPTDTASGNRVALLELLESFGNETVGEARRSSLPFGAETPPVQSLPWLQRPVFICGHQRSGTTLMQTLLDDHPEIVSLPSEGTYLSSFWYLDSRKPSDRALDRFVVEWIARLVNPNRGRHFMLGRSSRERWPHIEFARRLLGNVRQLQPHSPRPFAPLLALVAAYWQTTGRPLNPAVWVEKTPRNERFAGRLAAFEHARFIHLVRDPRHVIRSLAAIHREQGWPFDCHRHAAEVAESMQLARLNRKRLRQRYLLVRYEDLVTDTRASMLEVCQHIGIAAADSTSTPTAGGVAVVANSSFDRAVAGEILRQRRQLDLPLATLSVVGAHCRKRSGVFGYTLPPPHGIDRLRAVLYRRWRSITQASRAVTQRAAHCVQRYRNGW
jgi:Sulfotransferase family